MCCCGCRAKAPYKALHERSGVVPLQPTIELVGQIMLVTYCSKTTRILQSLTGPSSLLHRGHFTEPAAGTEGTQRVLSLAVVGLPNAGKSTLVNRLIGTKISGVSSKRNTTIHPQLGSFTVGSSQVLLYDTPGLVERHVHGNPLERLRSAWATAAMADQLLFIVDAERQVSAQQQSRYF